MTDREAFLEQWKGEAVPLPVKRERLPRLLLFRHADDAWRRPAGTPHGGAPSSSTAAASSLSSAPSYPARLPRWTPDLLVVVQHAPAAYGHDRRSAETKILT